MLERCLVLIGLPLFLASSKKVKSAAREPKRAPQPPRARAGKPTARAQPAPSKRPGASQAKRGAASGASTTAPQENVPAFKPQAPVAAPGLFSPDPAGSAESLTPSFRWFYVGGATHYELVWALDPRFQKAHILLTNQTAATLPPEQALTPGATYVWRVRAGNEGGWGPWSVVRTFRAPDD
jgi:hypothetical protein